MSGNDYVSDLTNRRIEIACKIWFTKSGTVNPLSFKFIGDDGVEQLVADVAVINSEDKNYDGIPSKEYECKAIIGGLLTKLKLIFYQEECRWVMII